MLQSKNKGKVFGISIAAILIFSGCGVKKPVEIHSAAVQETIHATEGAESEDETPLEEIFLPTESETETVAEAGDTVNGVRIEDARAFMETFVNCVINGEKEKASAMIRFPRKVTLPGQSVVVNDADEFIEYYDDIFTEDFIQVLKTDIKEELNWNYIGFWLGSGEVWLMQPVNEELMVESIFNGEERSVMYPGEPGIQAG